MVTVGALAANFLFAANPLPVAAGIAVGNTLEALLGAVILRRLGVKGEVSRVRDAVALLLVAVLAPLPSATGGVLSVTFAGFSSWDRYPWVWRVWWLGDFMGALLILPLILAWLGERLPIALPARPMEFAGVLAVTAAMVSFVSLRSDALAMLDVPNLPITPFLFPPMVWAVLRLRPRETTLVVAVASGIAVVYTMAIIEGETIGRLLWLQMILLGVGGGSLLMVGAMVERAQVQQELHASEVRFRTIFEQAAVGMARVGRNGRFLEVNRRLCEMLGYEREELLTKSFEEITVPSFLDEERRVLGELLAGRSPRYVIEKQYLRKDGSPVWVRITSSLPDQASSPYRISIVEDITKQRHAMAALKHAEEEAQAANRAKSTFLAAASHDLRQPVQALVLLNSVLSSRLKGHPAQPLVANIGSSLDALQRLLAALLDVSRLDAGVVASDVQAVPLGGIIERLKAEYALSAAKRGLSLRTVCSDAWTRTDPTLLERILRNLIENALKYTEQGKILVGCRRRGDTVRLQVIDTGIGIPPEHQEAIFQEFYQVGNPERDREKGLGLGLSIVNRLCRLLEHRLHMESVPGRGTCFIIDLPVVRPMAPPGVARPRAYPVQGNMAVLVVDDDLMIRQGLAQVLEDWGYQVLLAGDAGEAVGRVNETGLCPNAILADYRLPGGRTGIEAAKDVHRVCGQEIPSIIITGDTAPDRLAEAKASGFQLMHEPVQPDQLRQMINTLRS